MAVEEVAAPAEQAAVVEETQTAEESAKAEETAAAPAPARETLFKRGEIVEGTVIQTTPTEILVDLGGAETNSEMAVEMMPEERRERIVICNAPIVEGAVMAATEASGGSALAVVRATAEELMSA